MELLLYRFEFLKADILCFLDDYGEMTAIEIDNALNAGLDEVEDALFELVLERKVQRVVKDKYIAIDKLSVKRLKKNLPTVF
ncbi:MAG: hypothetical protein H6Q74_3039 [Firmicutes bacterium]|nr:hypothetical protein [Bacillota bacterium]